MTVEELACIGGRGMAPRRPTTWPRWAVAWRSSSSSSGGGRGCAGVRRATPGRATPPRCRGSAVVGHRWSTVICEGVLTPLWEHWLPQVVSRLWQARQVAERLRARRHPRRQSRRHVGRRGVRSSIAMPPQGPHGSPRQRQRRLAPSRSALGCRPTWQRHRCQRRARQRSRRACFGHGWVGSCVCCALC